MNNLTSLQRTIHTVSVGQPITRGGVSFFPVYTHGPQADIPTGARAGVVIGEKQVAEVPTLEAENPTAAPILLVDGEILTGGRQTRVLNVSVLLAPFVRVDIPVSCVEQGRWNGGGAFGRGSMFAPRRVRRAKNYTVANEVQHTGQKRTDQSEVWRAVRHEINRLEVQADTSSIESLHERFFYDDGLGDVAEELCSRGPLPGQCGVVITHGARVVNAEVFSSPEMLAAHWSAIVDAALLDAPAQQPGSRPSATKVLRFLRRIGEAHATVSQGVGLGLEYHVRTSKFVAQALVHDEIVVHASAFALAA